MVAAAVMGAAAVSAAGARTTTATKQDRPIVIRISVRWPHCESCGAADVGEIRCSYCGSLWRIGYRE